MVSTIACYPARNRAQTKSLGPGRTDGIQLSARIPASTDPTACPVRHPRPRPAGTSRGETYGVRLTTPDLAHRRPDMQTLVQREIHRPRNRTNTSNNRSFGVAGGKRGTTPTFEPPTRYVARDANGYASAVPRWERFGAPSAPSYTARRGSFASTRSGNRSYRRRTVASPPVQPLPAGPSALIERFRP